MDGELRSRACQLLLQALRRLSAIASLLLLTPRSKKRPSLRAALNNSIRKRSPKQKTQHLLQPIASADVVVSVSVFWCLQPLSYQELEALDSA